MGFQQNQNPHGLKKGDTSLCGATFGALVVCFRRPRPCGWGELSRMFGLTPRLESSLWAGGSLHDQVHIPPSLRTFVHPEPTHYRGAGAAVSLGRPCHDNRIVLPLARLWATPEPSSPDLPESPLATTGRSWGVDVDLLPDPPPRGAHILTLGFLERPTSVPSAPWPCPSVARPYPRDRHCVREGSLLTMKTASE